MSSHCLHLCFNVISDQHRIQMDAKTTASSLVLPERALFCSKQPVGTTAITYILHLAYNTLPYSRCCDAIYLQFTKSLIRRLKSSLLVISTQNISQHHVEILHRTSLALNTAFPVIKTSKSMVIGKTKRFLTYQTAFHSDVMKPKTYT